MSNKEKRVKNRKAKAKKARVNKQHQRKHNTHEDEEYMAPSPETEIFFRSMPHPSFEDDCISSLQVYFESTGMFESGSHAADYSEDDKKELSSVMYHYYAHWYMNEFRPERPPYSDKASMVEDIELMSIAWKKHYGNISDDFIPPIFEEDSGGLKAAGWVEVYRDMMLEKYKSLEIVEPKIKFNLLMLGDAITNT